MNCSSIAIIISTFVLAVVSPALCDVIQFNNDKQGWLDAVDEFSTIDFTGFPEHTWIFEQYAHLGAHFVDGFDQIQQSEFYLEDGWGIDGNSQVRITFDEPITYIGGEFPGVVIIRLFSDGELTYSSGDLGGIEPELFAGLISDGSFDEVQILDALFPFGGNVNIDNLYFGPPIPAPATLMLLGLGALVPARRRRTA